jgi:putative copper export protein
MGDGSFIQYVLMALLGAGAAYYMANRGKASTRPSINPRLIAAIILVVCVVILILIIMFAPRSPH